MPPTGGRSSTCSAACVLSIKCSVLLLSKNCIPHLIYSSDYLELEYEIFSGSLAMCCVYVINKCCCVYMTNECWTTARSACVATNANGPPRDFPEPAGQFSIVFVVLRSLLCILAIPRTLPIRRVHLLGTSDLSLGSEHANRCSVARAIYQLRMRFLQRILSQRIEVTGFKSSLAVHLSILDAWMSYIIQRFSLL